ncbi:MAG: amt1, partial [Myxococcaceae bacterium]|nr:amt1 [Myxococcaceae bacterium]
FGGVMLKSKLGYDDALDAFGVHGVGGLLGALLTGVLASAGWNTAVTKMGSELVIEQAIGAGVTAVYSVVVTFVLLKVLDATMGLRVDEDVEREGLDINLHGEQGYILAGEGGLMSSEEPAQGHGHSHATAAVVSSAT